MYIHEAVERAIEQNRHIALENFPGFKIQPTNGPGLCICKGGSKPSIHGWQPSAEDLISNNWILVD